MSVSRYLRMYGALDALNHLALTSHEREERSADLVERMDHVWRMLTPRQRLHALHARGRRSSKA